MGVTSLKRVYDMSFAEFQIRLFAWQRCEQRAWEKVRLLAWHTMNASMRLNKKMPSLENFMPLDIDGKAKSKVTEAQKKRFMEEYTNYLNKVKQWQG